MAVVAVAILCSSLVHLGSAQSCANPVQYDSGKDYFPDKVSPQLSNTWKIDYSNSYKTLTNVVSGEVFVLYQCGSPVPSTVPPGAHTIPVPVNYAAVSTYSVARFLERLGLRSRILYTPDKANLSSPCMLLAPPTSPSFPLANGTSVDTSAVVFQHAAQDGPVGTPLWGDETGGKWAGVPWQKVVLHSNTTTYPLAKLESLLLPLSAFFNLERSARLLMDQATSLYRCEAQASDTAAANAGGKITVAWVGVGGGVVGTNDVDYKEKVLLDAGAAPIVIPNAVNSLSALLAADVLIDETPGVSTLADLYNAYGFTDADKARFRFLANGRVYRTDRTRTSGGANDFDQSRLAVPEQLQQDISHILYPGINPGWKPIWLRNLAVATDVVTTVTTALCPGGNISSTLAQSYQNITCVETSVSIIATPSGAAKIFAPLAVGILLILAIVGGVIWYRRRKDLANRRRRREAYNKRKDYLKTRRPMSPVGNTPASGGGSGGAAHGDEEERKVWLKMDDVGDEPGSPVAAERPRSPLRGVVSAPTREGDLGESGFPTGDQYDWQPATLGPAVASAAETARSRHSSSGGRGSRSTWRNMSSGEREPWASLGSDSEIDDDVARKMGGLVDGGHRRDGSRGSRGFGQR
ncbi:hypothetical protein M427DRAFT_30971 [Gonapodya prolifera JEL478]|uniref:Peptidase A1 domain-containing protein n=1 Tax=Gonapodya prolifera (strain JEL478) TaxID=1344416 RepID=A0A139AJ97_GONPJ|nr:hypothetical protein M427DRAFT_30971 [Gonapodya prolifera JEL478]|eukprot:KXS16870.1 hypothetical protein M427DRAFT_30971 [Gonapodya prolifera JEL478]